MTAALIISIAVFVGASAWWLLSQPPCVKRRVIVNLKDDVDSGYMGILWTYRGSWMVLRDVTIHKRDSAPTKVDGETVFHRESVLFIQVLPGGEG